MGLTELFSKHDLERKYWALCYGKLTRAVLHKVETSIGRNPNDRKKMMVLETGGRKATTWFETLKFFPGYIGPIEGEVVAIGLLSLICAGLIVIPFIDIWTKKERWSPFLVLGAIALIYMIITTAISYYGMPKL